MIKTLLTVGILTEKSEKGLSCFEIRIIDVKCLWEEERWIKVRQNFKQKSIINDDSRKSMSSGQKLFNL